MRQIHAKLDLKIQIFQDCERLAQLQLSVVPLTRNEWWECVQLTQGIDVKKAISNGIAHRGEGWR